MKKKRLITSKLQHSKKHYEVIDNIEGETRKLAKKIYAKYKEYDLVDIQQIIFNRLDFEFLSLSLGGSL